MGPFFVDPHFFCWSGGVGQKDDEKQLISDGQTEVIFVVNNKIFLFVLYMYILF